MATETTISRPAPFVEDLGKDLATQAVALTGVPVVSGGIGSLSQQTGETAAGFKLRQDAARAFDNKTTKFSRTCTTSCRIKINYKKMHKQEQ